jgi:hypothetical protein
VAPRKRAKAGATKGGLIRKIRKPMAPPARIEEDTTKYRRERERERRRREERTQR